MSRQHIHMATDLPGKAKSGARLNCDVLIFLDLAGAMQAGCKFYRSANGVILSTGIDGCIPPEFFQRVTDQHLNPFDPDFP